MMLYQILLMIIIKQYAQKERQKERLYPDGARNALQPDLNNVSPAKFTSWQYQ